MGKLFGYGVIGLVVVVGLSVLFGSWYTVDQGDRATVLRNGALSYVADPGLHFKLPWIDSVYKVSTRTINRKYEKVAAYSRDQQPADMVVSVNYRIDPASVADLYTQYGNLDSMTVRLIDPRLYEQVKNVFGRFNAVTAIQDRTKLNLEIQQALQQVVANEPVRIESVQIENIDFSDAYEKSIEDRMQAEVEVQKLQQNAQREKVQAEIVVIQANAKASAIKANAEALAEQARLIGEGEADAIRAKGQALRENPYIIDLTKATKWDGVLPKTMLPNNTVPFLDMSRELAKETSVPVTK